MLELLSGGLLGALTSFGSSVLGYFTQKSKDAHELAMIDAKTNATIAVTKAKTDAQIEIGELEAFSNSMKQDKATYTPPSAASNWFSISLFSVVDFVRGMLRPVLTAGLVYMTFGIYVDMETLLTASDLALLTAVEAKALMVTVIDAIL